MTTTSTTDTTACTTIRVRDRRFAVGGACSTITSTPSSDRARRPLAPGGSSWFARIQLEPAARALFQCLLERLTGSEAEQLRRLSDQLSPVFCRHGQPHGDAAAGKHVETGGRELRRLLLDQQIAY